MSVSLPLREAVKSRFYPFVEGRGFVRTSKPHPLFTTFQRVSGHVLQVFDVQWDKYHRQKFIINFGEYGDALTKSQGQLKEIDVVDCSTRGRLQQKANSVDEAWFELRKPWSEVLRTLQWQYSPEQVADNVSVLFEELELWWKDKRIGPHLRFMHIPPIKKSFNQEL